ncbi:MAG: hypothetical protein AB4038_02965 [Prochloraceae cyanobacterium]
MNAQDLRLDYFKIYDVRDYRVNYRIDLQGQFDEEAEKAELFTLTHFATPVSKNQEPIYNRNAHLLWYRLYQPMPEPSRIVEVENQFGLMKIFIGKPYALLAPASKRGNQFPVELDHFKLYQVLDGEPVNQKVALQDQFGSIEAKVLYPLFFGVPVKKTYRENVSPIYNEKAHLIIYRITPRSLQEVSYVRDQFDKYFLYCFRSLGLAVPSLKLRWNET